MHLHNFFQTIHSALLQICHQNNCIWNLNGRLQFPKNLTHQCTKKSLSKNSCFRFKKISSSSQNHYLKPGLYPSLTNFVEAMNTLIQERHNHSESCITVKVSRRTQKVEINHANEGFRLSFFRTNLGHFFRSNVSDEFGVILRRKGPHKPEFA